MVGNNATTKSTGDFTAPRENPFLRNGMDLNHLMHNLQRNDPAWMCLMLRGYEPLRLEAIKAQAASLKELSIINLISLGKIVAVAAASGEADMRDLSHVGWLTSFLAELAAMTDSLEANAQYEIENPQLCVTPSAHKSPASKLAGSEA
jgi:hypothetical protein